MTSAHSDWWKTLGLLTLVWIAITALLHPTAMNMAAIWERSDTYAHGYVVLPIALWLVWRKRHALMAAEVRPDLRLLILIAASAGLWMVARLMNINVVEQYAYVALLIGAAWLILGHAASRVILFPLFFLLLMVPNGDNFLPLLMDIATDITVFTLRLWGLPVYREGTFFSIPGSDWSVVEGCSGIRYIISSVTLGMLYAYLTYRTLWKRIAFTVAAFVVPIIANGLRAVLIVLIAHYSDMRMALGVDHFIYGWVWFGIVMLIMFAVGNIWREDMPEHDRQAAPPAGHRLAVVPATVLLVVVALFPAYSVQMEQRTPLPSPLARVAVPPGWQVAEAPVTTWTPRWSGLDDQRSLHLRQGEAQAMLFLGWYGSQRQGAELINFDNKLVVEKDPLWRNPTRIDRRVELGGTPLHLHEATVDSPVTGQRMLVWYWNRAGGLSTTSVMRLKLTLGMRKLAYQPDHGAVVILAAPYQHQRAEAEAVLQRLATALKPGLDPVLDAP